MENRKFDYFMMVVREGSISAAAKKLFITQPSLSKFLARLENELGAKLLDRSSNPLRLTVAGEKYVEYIKKAVDLQQDLKSQLRLATEERIMLGITPWRGSFILPKILSVFKEKYPLVELKIIEESGAELYSLLAKKKLDIIVSAFPCDDEDVFREPMCRERLLILIPKQFNLIPEDKRKDNSPWNPYEIDMKELKGKRIITTKPGQKLYEDIKNIANKFELTHNDLIEIGNMNSLLRLADSGHGVGIIPELYIKSGPHFENIDYCYCSDSLFWWDVAAYYRQELISPAARFLIKSICECMK